MPELPEVETVRRVLVDWMEGKTIQRVDLPYPMIVDYENKQDFVSILTGQKIEKINRIGKYLIFDLGEYQLISHLRMEGKYFRVFSIEEFNRSYYFKKHTHMLLHLNDGSIILYHDVRKFGRFNLVKTEELMTNSPIAKLGPEPFNEDASIVFYHGTRDSKLTLKEALLDQSLIAGIGNIYADEICFASGFYPFTKVCELNFKQIKLMVKNAIKILSKAIELGGSTVHSYSSGNGVDGKFQEELQVYNQEGKLCPRCGSPITKIRLGGRGTCFCSCCQTNTKKGSRVIGITGLIAAGKSKVSSLLKEQGYEILDADEIVEDCYKSSNPISLRIINLFGDEILDENGEIDKNKVRPLVKNNPSLLKKLEDILHPEVRAVMMEKIKDTSKKFVLDVPLLFESKFDKMCDVTVFVTTNEKVRVDRLIARGKMSLQDAKNFNFNIEDAYKKIKASDYIIDNSLSIENTRNQIKALLNKIS